MIKSKKNKAKFKERNNKTHWGKKLLKLLRILFLIFFISSIFIVILYKFINPPVSSIMVERFIQQAVSKDRKVKIKKTWISLDRTSSQMLNAIVTSEDDLFFKHSGFNIKELKKSYKENKSGKKKRIRGGSTITMQTAKNLFLIDKRSYVRKGLESYFTVLMEFFWSKERILEVYLNIIEFGDGIYGCEAASLYYFNKPASKLTAREAALLAACVPSPLKRNPANPSKYVSGRASQIQSLTLRANPYGVWLNEKKEKEVLKNKDKAQKEKQSKKGKNKSNKKVKSKQEKRNDRTRFANKEF